MSENITNNNNNNNITNITYDKCTFNNFFASGNLILIIIIFVFIIISFILNLIIMIILCKYKRQKQYSLTGILTWNIFIFNLLHTCSYIVNWFIKDNEKSEGINYGCLLFSSTCKIQASCLIFFSLSQDIIINVFSSFIIFGGKNGKYKYGLILILAGYIFPMAITIIYYRLKIIGIDEQYCYISKYFDDFEDKYKDQSEDEIGDKKEIEYIVKDSNKYYNCYKIIIVTIRFINCLITLFLIIKGKKFIKENKPSKKEKKPNKKVDKIGASLLIFIFSFISLLIYLIFEITSIITTKIEPIRTRIYVIINSFESILLPLLFSIKHEIYVYLCCLRSPKYNKIVDGDSSMKEIEIDQILEDIKEERRSLKKE